MSALVVMVLTMIAIPVLADPTSKPEVRLDAELDRLESRVIQRQNRPPRTSDLLTGQDLKIAERKLNTLKTRAPRNTRIPLLSRQLDRLQRQNRRFNR